MDEYQEFRKKYTFLELCKNPEEATKVTMLPIDLLDVDAAILFSDILVPIEAMGMHLEFSENKGPVFKDPIRTEKDLERLSVPEPEEKVPFVMDTIKLVKKELNGKVPLIGFSGAPFTLMSYMVEGGSSKDLKTSKQMLCQNPKLAHAILEKITETTIKYLNAQIDAGAEAVQIFDTWAGLLSHEYFLEFSLKYIQKIVENLNRKDCPVIIFAKGSSVFYSDIAKLKPDVISIDWNADISKVKKEVNPITVQGNLDPYLLYGDKDSIKKSTKHIIDSMKQYDGYIFNLGHGVMPDIPFDNVRYLVDCVKELGVYD